MRYYTMKWSVHDILLKKCPVVFIRCAIVRARTSWFSWKKKDREDTKKFASNEYVGYGAYVLTLTFSPIIQNWTIKFNRAPPLLRCFWVIKLLIKSYSIGECTPYPIRVFFRATIWVSSFVHYRIHISEKN